jgi:hypothetical protein
MEAIVGQLLPPVKPIALAQGRKLLLGHDRLHLLKELAKQGLHVGLVHWLPPYSSSNNSLAHSNSSRFLASSVTVLLPFPRSNPKASNHDHAVHP